MTQFKTHENKAWEHRLLLPVRWSICGVLLILALTLSQTHMKARKSGSLNNESGNAQTPHRLQERITELPVLIRLLSEDDPDVRDVTQQRMLALAKTSAHDRKRVITELLKAVEMPAFSDRIDTPSGSHLWVESCKIFAELKALEAIDALTACIFCTAITEAATDRYRHKPAVIALTQIGAVAVRRLAEALSDQDTRVRRYSALTLGLIGGGEAKLALTKSLRLEKDLDVRKAIEDALFMGQRRRAEDRMRNNP
jgi:hypothetical protein